MSNLTTTALAIEAGYAEGKSGMDDDMLQHLIALGDMAEQILTMHTALRAIAETLADHPDASKGNTKVHYALHTARMAAP